MPLGSEWHWRLGRPPTGDDVSPPSVGGKWCGFVGHRRAQGMPPDGARGLGEGVTDPMGLAVLAVPAVVAAAAAVAAVRSSGM